MLSVAGREGLPVPDEGRGSDEFDQRDNPPQFPFHPDYTTPSSVKHDLLNYCWPSFIAWEGNQKVVIWGQGRSIGPQRGLAMWVLRVILSEGMVWVLLANEVLGRGCRDRDRGYPFLSGCWSSTWR